MKTIISYIRNYFAEEWNPKLFLFVAALLLLSFSINYMFGFEVRIIRLLDNPVEQFIFYFFFYALPFLGAVLCYAVVTERSAFLHNPDFWKLGLLFFAVLAAYIAIHNLPSYIYKNAPSAFGFLHRELQWYSTRCIANLLPGLIVFFPIVAYWYSKDGRSARLYGFNSSNIRLGTYAGIILVLLPVVFATSFASDFQSAYPRHKFGLPPNIGGVERAGLVGIFELCYGADFVFVEFIFRGFMVMAFARYLGKGSILPMVVVYAFIHFQKPLGEAIGSIAGGLVLGIISYETKSIYGGVILHLGVAYMMEIAGTLQLLMRKVI